MRSFESRAPVPEGNLAERALLGDVRNHKDFELDEIPVSYEEALADVKANQKDDLDNPRATFANELRIELLDQLGLVEREDWKRLRYYTAVGSAFDTQYRCDAFFEFDRESNPELDPNTIRITIGVTTNPDKAKRLHLKTDVEFLVPPDGFDGTENEFDDIIYQAAEAIVSKILQKVEANVRTVTTFVDLR